jgi:hypothetical protein
MIPSGPQADGCDFDASIGIAPAGFSKESASTALILIELKSKSREVLKERDIVFVPHNDIIAIYENRGMGFRPCLFRVGILPEPPRISGNRRELSPISYI